VSFASFVLLKEGMCFNKVTHSFSALSFGADAVCISAKAWVMYPAIWFLIFVVVPCISVPTMRLLSSKLLENLFGKRLISSLAIRLICSVRTFPKLQFPPNMRQPLPSNRQRHAKVNLS